MINSRKDAKTQRSAKKRKIIVSLATSADGFIARKDGGIDWLDRPRPKGNYGMGEFWKSIDTILLGRKTYDFVVQFVRSGKSIPKQKHEPKHYVFSHRPPKKVLPGFEFVKEPIKKFATRLRNGLVVRESAVIQSPEGPYVLVASADRRTFTKRPVQIGSTDARNP